MTDKLSLCLYKSIEMANFYHKDQLDKGGSPYILHPLRVMSKIKGYSMESYKLRTLAVLHDIIEDTDINKDLLSFLDSDVYDALIAITKVPRQSYSDYLLKCKSNCLARQVKLLDLEDNMDMSRLSKITDKDVARYKKYCDAVRFLEN